MVSTKTYSLWGGAYGIPSRKFQEHVSWGWLVMKHDRVSEGGIIITLKLKTFPSCGPDDVSGTTLKSRVRTRYLRHPAMINPQNSLKTLKSLWKLSKLFENSQDFKNSQNSNYSRKTLKTPKTLETLQKLSKLSKNSQNSQNSQKNLKTPKTPKTPEKISKLLKLFALVHFFWSDLPLGQDQTFYPVA